MERLKFTKQNLIKFWNSQEQTFDGDNADDYFNFIFSMADKLQKTFVIPRSAGEIEDIVANLIDNNFDMIITEYDDAEEASQSKALSCIDASDAEKEWKRTPEVLANFKQMLSYASTLSENELLNLLASLQLTSNNFRLGPGTICCPRKYLAKTPRSIVDKIPDNVLVVELKINSSTAANYRAYGFILNNVLYILSVYTKTSGQEAADKDFDNFVEKIPVYIKDHKLIESLSYNMIEEIKMETSVFEELDKINEEQRLDEYCQGRNDAFDNKVIENEVSASYLAGYNDVKHSEKLNNFKKWFNEHRTEAKEFIKKSLKA